VKERGSFNTKRSHSPETHSIANIAPNSQKEKKKNKIVSHLKLMMGSWSKQPEFVKTIKKKGSCIKAQNAKK